MAANTNCTYRTTRMTDEELVILWGRLQSGPYRVAGDVSLRSPDDGNRIKAKADQFKANTAIDDYTNYYKGNLTVKHPISSTGVGGFNYDPGDRGLRIVCAALYYAASRANAIANNTGTGDTSYGLPVKAKLLETARGTAGGIASPLLGGYASYVYNGTRYKAFDYANKQRYPNNWSSDVAPGFTMAGLWWTFLMDSFEYVKPLFTNAQEFNDVNNWFTSIATMALPHYETYMNDQFVIKNAATRSKEQDYRVDDPAVQLNGSTELMYYGGPNAHQLERGAGNRRMDFASIAGCIGVMQGNQTFINSAKLFFKELIMFSTWPTSHYVDIFRGTSEEKPSKGMGYSGWSSMIRFADSLARKGDTEMYNWSTNKGSISPAMYNALTTTQKADNKWPVSDDGSHTSDGVTFKSLRTHIYSLCNLRNHVGSGADKNATYVPIYATDDPALYGNPAYIIDGNDTIPVVKYSVDDCALAPAALYYKDDYIDATLQRTHPNSIPYPSSPQVSGPIPGFCTGSNAGNLIMYARTRTLVYPYPTTGQQAQTINFAQPADVAYGATRTLGATATSGLAISYAISPASVGGGTIAGGVFTPTKAGSVTITASQGGDASHTAAPPVSRTFLVTKALVTITAMAAERPYNKIDPTFSATYTGLVNGETSAVIDTPPSFTTNATLTSVPGAYVITPAGAVDNNYSFAYATGIYTVKKGTVSFNVTANLNKLTTDGPFTFTTILYEEGTTNVITGIPLVYSLISGSSVSSVNSSSGLVTLSGSAGNSIIQVGDAANDYYFQWVAQRQVTVTASAKTAQTTTFNALSTVIFGAAPGSLAATASSGLAVTFESSAPAIASISGTTITYHKAGVVNIIAHQLGNATYASAPDVIRQLTISKKTLTVTGTAATKVYGTPIPTLAHNAITGWVGSDTESVLTTPITQTSNATQTSNVGSYNVIPGGGFADNYAFTYANGVLAVTKANQTVVITSIQDMPLNSPPFLVTASATSGLTPVLTILSGPATISSGIITLTGTTGTVVVAVNQAGNGNYNAAPQATEPFAVTALSPVPQVLTIPTIPTQVYGTTSVPVVATSSSDLTVSVTVFSGPGTLPSSTVACPTTLTITGAGTVVLRFTQAGNSSFLPATVTDKNVVINKAPQAITFGPIADKGISSGFFDVAGTASSGLDVVFSTDNSGVLEQLDNDSFSPMAGGDAVITASQPGDSNYLAAPSVTQHFAITTSAPPVVVDILNGITGVPTSTNIGTGVNQYKLFRMDYLLAGNYQLGPRLVLTSGHGIPDNIISQAKVYFWNGLAFELLTEIVGNTDAIHNQDVPGVSCIGKIMITFPRISTSKVDSLVIYGVSI